MSETEKEPETSDEVELKEPPSPKNQLVALLTLLPVLGVLWLFIHYLPKFGDWMGAKADTVASVVAGEKDPADTAIPQVSTDSVTKPSADSSAPDPGRSPSNESPLLSVGPASDVSLQKEGFKSQIVDKLGGTKKVEVRHLALSDDAERMVAALKIEDNSGGSGLIEVFFERDEFGRYISSEDSPVPEKLVIWSE